MKKPLPTAREFWSSPEVQASAPELARLQVERLDRLQESAPQEPASTMETAQSQVTREQAIQKVRAYHPHLQAGTWTAVEAGGEWAVEYRYHGRRRASVEAFVLPDGTVEDLDGKPYSPRSR